MAREALRRDPEIEAALDDAWVSCCDAGNKMSRDAYFCMMRKLYLLTVLEEGDGELDVKECERAMTEGWAEDAGGHEFLYCDGFRNAWFQLAGARHSTNERHSNPSVRRILTRFVC